MVCDHLETSANPIGLTQKVPPDSLYIQKDSSSRDVIPMWCLYDVSTNSCMNKLYLFVLLWHRVVNFSFCWQVQWASLTAFQQLSRLLQHTLMSSDEWLTWDCIVTRVFEICYSTTNHAIVILQPSMIPNSWSLGKFCWVQRIVTSQFIMVGLFRAFGARWWSLRSTVVCSCRFGLVQGLDLQVQRGSL